MALAEPDDNLRMSTDFDDKLHDTKVSLLDKRYEAQSQSSNAGMYMAGAALVSAAAVAFL